MKNNIRGYINIGNRHKEDEILTDKIFEGLTIKTDIAFDIHGKHLNNHVSIHIKNEDYYTWDRRMTDEVKKIKRRG